MNDLEKAIGLLNGEVTCVLCCDEVVHKSTRTGIRPMLDFLESGTSLAGFSAADRIIGKAAAMLFVLADVRAVYGEVMSEAAVPVFAAAGIEHHCGTLTPHIINRRGDGLCPMEQAVANLTDPADAPAVLRATLARLATGQ